MGKKLNQLGAIGWMMGVSALILFGCSSLRHALFQSTALDLAVFDQWVYLASQGLPPVSSLLGFHLLGDHAAFILYAIALLYKVYPNVHWLFAVQAIALAAGVFPVYALSLQTGLSVAYARAVALSYLLYPALFNINFYTDFRPEAIAVPALLWAMWAGIGGRTSQFIVAVAVVLSCKDILSLSVIALGLWLWIIQRRRLYGLGCIVVGTVWFAATVYYLVPMLRGGQVGGVVFYGSLGSSVSEILWKMITEPGLILGKFFLPDTLFYYLLLILPVIIGLHWQQVMIMVPALPMLLLNILSDYSAQRDLIHHYSLPIFPFIVLWFLRSLHQYQEQRKRPWLKPNLIVLWTLITFLTLAKYDYFLSRYLANISRLNYLNAAVSLVNTQESILTTSKIAPHLSHRPLIKITSTKLEHLQPIENKFKYILLDLHHTDADNTPELLNILVEQLKSNQKFNLSYQRNDVYLFTRSFSDEKISMFIKQNTINK